MRSDAEVVLRREIEMLTKQSRLASKTRSAGKCQLFVNALLGSY